MYIKNSTAKKIFKDAGAERVSDDALRAFETVMDRIAFDAAKKSVSLSKHAKRKTVYGSDVELAFR
jgi:histone H3/H4